EVAHAQIVNAAGFEVAEHEARTLAGALYAPLRRAESTCESVHRLRRLPEDLEAIEVRAPCRVAHREGEPSSPGRERRRAAIYAEPVVDERRHAGDGLPVGRGAKGMGCEVVREDVEDDVAVRVDDDV